MSKKTLNYDSAYAELETIVEALQNDSLGLEEINSKMQRAFELLNFCRTRLREIESDFEDFFQDEEE